MSDLEKELKSIEELEIRKERLEKMCKCNNLIKNIGKIICPVGVIYGTAMGVSAILGIQDLTKDDLPIALFLTSISGFAFYFCTSVYEKMNKEDESEIKEINKTLENYKTQNLGY